MRIHVDSLVAARCADLVADTSTDLVIEVFDPYATPWELRRTFESFRPEVIMVDPAMVVVSFLFLEIVKGAECRADCVVLGAPTITDVLKVQASRGGFFDVVDVSRSIDDVVDHIRHVHQGRSHLADDRLWVEVARPRGVPSLMIVPQDRIDIEILDLIAIGLPNEEIAAVVHVAVQTVRNRVSGMLKRSRMSNRTELAWTYTNQMLAMSMAQGMSVNGQRSTTT